jgi:hypothetical protein
MRALVALDHRYFGITKFADDLILLEEKTSKEGIATAARWFLNKHSITYPVNKDVSAIVRQAKKKGKSLFVLGVNHTLVFEPLIIASILNDTSMNIVAIKFLQRLGRQFNKQVIPVLPKRFGTDYGSSIKSKLKDTLDPATLLYYLEHLTVDQIRSLNITSLKQAAQLLKERETLVLFPAGGRDEHAKWKAGIGHILLNAEPQIWDQIDILPMYFSHPEHDTLVTHFRKSIHGKAREFRVNVKVGDTIPLSNLINKKEKIDPLQIAEYLQHLVMKKFRLNR